MKGVSMETKAKLLSPVLIIAMVVSLLAGALAVLVTPQGVSAQADLDVEISTSPGLDYQYNLNLTCGQTFAVKAKVTNNGDVTATGVSISIDFNDYTKAKLVAPDWVQVLPDIEEGCTAEAEWTFECMRPGELQIHADVAWTGGSDASLTIYVNQYLDVKITAFNDEEELFCPGYEVCPSENFTLEATITNTGNGTVELADFPIPIFIEPGENFYAAQVPGTTNAWDYIGYSLDSGESITVWWDIHCREMSDDVIDVWVEAWDPYYLGYYFIGHAQYAFHQRGLMVDIVMPYPGQVFCESQNFYVNAVVTNTCSDVITDVYAWLEICGAANWVSGGDPDYDYEQYLGDIGGKYAADVWWEVHCNELGAATFIVEADGYTAFGQYVYDYDSVTVLQGPVLEVEIVEPPFEWSPDGFTVCESQTFVVKAHVRNVSCPEIGVAIGVEATIRWAGAGTAWLIIEESQTKPLGTIAYGQEAIVGWTMHCGGPGPLDITVEATAYNVPPASDSVTVNQAAAEENVTQLSVMMVSPKTSDKFCAGCADEFTVTAVVSNLGCTPAEGVTAELIWSCGPGSGAEQEDLIALAEGVTATQSLDTIPGIGKKIVTWDVVCTGPGDVDLWVLVEADNAEDVWTDDNLFDTDPVGPDPVTDPVTIHQQDFIVEILDVDGTGHTAVTFSTCQEFTVTARFTNCSDVPQVEIQGIIDYSSVGARLAEDSKVVLSYFDENGNPKQPFTVEEAAADQVEFATLCACCYVDVTWTLECVMAINGDITVWAETKGGIFLDSDSTAANGWFLITGGEVSLEGKYYDCGYAYEGVISGTLTGIGTLPDGDYCVDLIGSDGYDFSFNGTMSVTSTAVEIKGVFWSTSSVWPPLQQVRLTGMGGFIVKNGDVMGGHAQLGGFYGTVYSINQQWKPHLVAGIAAFAGAISEPVDEDTFEVEPSIYFSQGQDFTVVVTVSNIGQATALEVEATIDIDGLASTTEPLTKYVEAVEGMPGVLPGMQSGKVMWVLRCTGLGTVDIELTALSGIDANTGEAIPADNIETLCAITVYQVISELTVEIIQPVTCTTITACTNFTVKALVTNGGDTDLPNVTAMIKLTDPDTGLDTHGIRAEMNIAEPTYPSAKDIYPIRAGMTHEVAWVVHCLATGDVEIRVIAVVADLKAVSPAVTIHQVAPAEISVNIVSPCNWTFIATSQEFAVTALISNARGSATADIVAGIGLDNSFYWHDKESLGTGDGVTTDFYLQFPPVIPGSEEIWVDGNLIPWESRALYYTIDYTSGTVTFLEPPALGKAIEAYYVSGDPWLLSHSGGLSLIGPELIQDLGELPGGASKIVSWTMHCDSSWHEWVGGIWENGCWKGETGLDVVAYGVDSFGYEIRGYDWVDLWQYPAAHLEVEITAPPDASTYTVCDEFTVTAKVANTGWCDAWEVRAILSVEPEGSVRVASDGYTKYLGTLVGYGQEAVADLGYQEVSWTVHCKAACESTITVTATGRDECGFYAAQILGGNWTPADVPNDEIWSEGYSNWYGYYDQHIYDVTEWSDDFNTNLYPGIAIPSWLIEPDSITVKQVEPAALVVESLISPAQVEVCQDFKVSAIVKNVGGSTATDVVATIDVTGIDATLTGTADYDLDDIAAGSLKVASWQLHCDGAGSGSIAVTADAANTAPAMAAGGVLQVTPAAVICLTVAIDAPAEVTTEQTYFVTAVVTNLCGLDACEVFATITISGEAELASGEQVSKPLGCVEPGDSEAVDWEVDCTDVGGVNIWVSASGTGTNTAIDSVAVRQAEVLDLSALSTPLNSIDATLSTIDGNVVTIKSDIGTIKGNVADINLKVTSIDEGVATIESNLGTLKGTVSDISDGVATIVTDLGTVKADVSQIADDTGTLKSRSIWTLPILILVAIGAIAVIVGVAIVASRKRPVPVVIERKGEE